MCRVRRSECSRHHMWERQRAALLDLHLVRIWQSLDDLLEAERILIYANRQRRGFIGVLLNSTISHVAPPVAVKTVSEQPQPAPSSDPPEKPHGEVAIDEPSASTAAENANDEASRHQESNLAVAIESGVPTEDLQVESVLRIPLAQEPMDIVDTSASEPANSDI